MAAPADGYEKEKYMMPTETNLKPTSTPQSQTPVLHGENDHNDALPRLPPWRQPIARLELYSISLSNTSVNSFCGAMAGVASGVVTCPLDVIKTKLQAQGGFRLKTSKRLPSSRAVYHGMLGTAKVIWVEDGLRGMYRGLGPMLLGYLPTWAVYMSVYESSKDFYYQRTGTLLSLHM